MFLVKITRLIIIAVIVFVIPSSLQLKIYDINDYNDGHVHGKNGWFVPQFNGSFIWMDLDTANQKLIYEEREEIMRDLFTRNDIKFFLYTRDHPDEYEEIIDTKISILNSSFRLDKPTRFVTHGWLQGYFSPMNQQIRKAWLEVNDFNVIWVDWNRARTLNYISAAAAVPKVGERIAQMIDYLVTEHNVQLNTLDIIGHSLGAHVAGYAGKNVKSGMVNIIVGLDPAEPLFLLSKPEKRLSINDARYVEIIHTNAGLLGFLEPIGDSDFYVNGGRSQPGCFIDLAGVCSHNRVANYYAEAIKMDNFPAIKCDSYKEAIKGKCGSTYSTVRMAASINALIVRGQYYVPINKKSPYGVLDN